MGIGDRFFAMRERRIGGGSAAALTGIILCRATLHERVCKTASLEFFAKHFAASAAGGGAQDIDAGVFRNELYGTIGMGKMDSAGVIRSKAGVIGRNRNREAAGRRLSCAGIDRMCQIIAAVDVVALPSNDPGAVVASIPRLLAKEKRLAQAIGNFL